MLQILEQVHAAAELVVRIVFVEDDGVASHEQSSVPGHADAALATPVGTAVATDAVELALEGAPLLPLRGPSPLRLGVWTKKEKKPSRSHFQRG